MVRWLREHGLRGASAFDTEYGDERRRRRRSDAEARRGSAGGRTIAMKRFARLFAALDATHLDATRKVDALRALLRARAAPRDAAWAVYFLAGGKPRQAVPTQRAARRGASRRRASPRWLFDECYQAVGDLAETIAHVLPPPRATSDVGLRRVDRGAPAAAARPADPETVAARLRGVLGRARRRRALPAGTS